MDCDSAAGLADPEQSAFQLRLALVMTQYIAVRDEGCGFGFSYCGPFHRLARAERFKAELEKVSDRKSVV